VTHGKTVAYAHETFIVTDR